MTAANDADRLTELLTTAVCGISVGDELVRGTGWLASPGVVLTAGHLMAAADNDVKVTFPGRPPLSARVVTAAHRPSEGVDFAVLNVELTGHRITPFPVALVHAPRGSFTSAGYGVTLRSISAGVGEFVGPFDPHNDARFRLFRCRSQELAEPGYSGAPIISAELGAVVGIQIEAVTGARGARDTVLAMPLYRVASAWNRLEEIEAEQAASDHSPAGRQVIVVTARAGDSGNRIAAGLRARGFMARQVVVTRAEILEPEPGFLSEDPVVLLVADGLDGVLEHTRELVIAAVVRQLALIVVADSTVAMPSYLRGFTTVATVDDALAAVSSASADVVAEIEPAAFANALEAIQTGASDPGRFQPRIDELRSIVGGWSSRRERQDRRIEALVADLPSPAEDTASLAPAVGVRPFDPQHLFRDRVREATDISKALADPSISTVSVLGRAGIGKTALAARLMNALRAQRWFHNGPRPHIDGLVYLSTRTSSGISSDEVILKLAQLSGASDLFRIWSTRSVPLHRRVAAVLEALGDRRIVVLLDNLEDLLDEAGGLTGVDELGALMTELMMGASPVSFLITSREQVEFPSTVLPRTRVVELRTGLPRDESVRMLRELDPQAEYGLAVSSDEVLGRLSAAVHGLPRALQLIAGMLANDPLLTVAELVARDMPAVDESLSELIAESLVRLDRPARWVLLALSVAGRPIPVGGVDFLLRPFAPGLDVPSLVRRLSRTQIVSSDRTTKQVALHPADRRYILRQAAEEQDAVIALMHRRAADYYLRTAGAVTELLDADSIRPVLIAVEHLMRSGDHHEVAEVLEQYGDVLENIGLYQATIGLAQSLADVAVGDDWIRNAMRLGRLSWLMGDAVTAMNWLTEAEEAATTNGDQRTLPAILVDLAAAQRDAGNVRASLRTFRRALDLAGRQNDGVSRTVARGLLQATHTLRPMGFLTVTNACAERAAALTEGDAGSDPAAAFLLSGALTNAAVSDCLLGDTSAARARLAKAREIAHQVGDRGHIAYADCVLAGLERITGTPEAAVPLLLGSLETYEEIGDRWGLAATLSSLSWVYADMLDVSAAATTIQRARVAANGCNPRAAASVILAESVLARRRGDLVAAVRLASEAMTAYGNAEFPLYGAWARCELATASFLLGEAVGSEELFVRATPLTRAVWQVLRALFLVATDEADAAIGTAWEALAGVNEGHAWRMLPAGWLAAAESCRTGTEPAPAVTGIFEAYAAAPGVLQDSREILGRLADSRLPGSRPLRRVLTAQPGPFVVAALEEGP